VVGFEHEPYIYYTLSMQLVIMLTSVMGALFKEFTIKKKNLENISKTNTNNYKIFYTKVTMFIFCQLVLKGKILKIYWVKTLVN